MQLATDIIDGKLQDVKHKVVNELIFYEDRVYLVPGSKVKEGILRACHDTPLVGHPGIYKTYKQMRERFSWKGLKNDVLQHVTECLVSTKQNRPCFSNWLVAAPAHSKSEMGDRLHGFHHRVA